ncbi:MAG: hypothetical protein K0R15_1729 [Clostridiales bacterium]|nr:hypothetical protein [Clostridiales bacterium]
MSKSKVFFISTFWFLLGLVLGFLISPIKQGIGNNSGNTTNNYYDKEDVN